MDFNVLFLISDFSFFLMFTFLNEAEAKGKNNVPSDLKLVRFVEPCPSLHAWQSVYII